MEKFRPQPEMPREEPIAEPEMVYRSLDRRKEKDLLAEFTPEQQAEIKHKQQILSMRRGVLGVSLSRRL